MSKEEILCYIYEILCMCHPNKLSIKQIIDEINNLHTLELSYSQVYNALRKAVISDKRFGIFFPEGRGKGYPVLFNAYID